MGLFDRVTNWVMPQEDIYEEEEDLQVADKKADTASQRADVRRVANGAPIFITDPQPVSHRPELTVHTNPAFAAPEMKVAVFTPVKFEDAAAIADAIKSKQAVIVNFERTDAREQQRIFDFLNGACYVLGGDVTMVSAGLILYVPSSIKVEDRR